jgi:hypothetical protein
LEIEIEIEIEIDESVDKMLLDPELELTLDSSLIVGEGQVSTGARGVFSIVCGTTSPSITGGRGGIYVGGAGKRSRRSLKESRRLLGLDLRCSSLRE